MSSIETADPAQLTDSSEDAIVAEVSAMLGGAESAGLEPPVDAAAESAPIQTTEVEPLTEATVEATLVQVETDLMRLQEALSDAHPEIPIKLKTAADQPLDEAPVEETAAETQPAAQEEAVLAEAAAQAIEDSSPAPDIEAAVVESKVVAEGKLAEGMEPASEVVPASSEPAAEGQGESVEAAALEAVAPESEKVVEFDGAEPLAADPEPTRITQEQVPASGAATANSEAAAPSEPSAQKPVRRWYHPLRMVQGLAAALVEILVLVDMPFASLSPTIKAIVACAGLATGAIAVATWGSIIYRNLNAG